MRCLFYCCPSRFRFSSPAPVFRFQLFLGYLFFCHPCMFQVRAWRVMQDVGFLLLDFAALCHVSLKERSSTSMSCLLRIVIDAFLVCFLNRCWENLIHISLAPILLLIPYGRPPPETCTPLARTYKIKEAGTGLCGGYVHAITTVFISVHGKGIYYYYH